MAEIDRILASTHSESIEIMTRGLVAFVCRKEIISMEHDTLLSTYWEDKNFSHSQM